MQPARCIGIKKINPHPTIGVKNTLPTPPAKRKFLMESTALLHEPLWPKVEHWVARSEAIFIKKLSRNDTSWASDPRKHQAGFYVPKEIRDAGFFPVLIADNPQKPHIFHADFPTFWPQTGETKASGMRHFSNKGPEAHLTIIPKEIFSGISPASLLVCGRLKEPLGEVRYWMIVLDSTGEDAEVLETVLDLEATFHFGIFEPSQFRSAKAMAADQIAELIDRLKHAIATNTLEEFIENVTRLPSPSELALAAQQAWLIETGHDSLDPYKTHSPGDVLMRISRDIEYRIFRHYELRRRSAEVVRVLTSSAGDIVTAAVRGFSDLDAIFLSASQQRKTRAGRSFENHISRMLHDGGIRFVEQPVLGGRRPDFVLPDMKVLSKTPRDHSDALILSAKTTLRERWKQLSHERFNCDIYLATVDDRVPFAVIESMATEGITLVVPESLKGSKESCYPTSKNVISFEDFFCGEISDRRPFLLSRI